MLDDKLDLRAILLAIVKTVAEEAERNQQFGDRLRAALRGHERPTRCAAPVQDPFEILQLRGVAGLREWLASLDIKELKAIIREHRLDDSRLSQRWKTKQRFVDLILGRITSRSAQGESFREYGVKPK